MGKIFLAYYLFIPNIIGIFASQQNGINMDYTSKNYFFGGKPYTGDAAFINGSNGYTHSENHGMLCALIPDKVGVRSCWDKDGKPNSILDENGNTIIDPEMGCNGLGIEISNGKFNQFYRTR